MATLPPQIPTCPEKAASSAVKTWIVQMVNERIPSEIDRISQLIDESGGSSYAKSALDALKSSLKDNGVVAPLTDSLPDVDRWNQAVQSVASSVDGGKDVRFQDLPLLWTESYIRRRISGILSEAELPNDEFREAKGSGFYEAYPLVSQTSMHLMEAVQELQDPGTPKTENLAKYAAEFLLLSAFTTPLSSKFQANAEGLSELNTPFQEAAKLKDSLLVDRLESIVQKIIALASLTQNGHASKSEEEKKALTRRVDFVLGGTQLELFVDLCLAEILIAADAASEVVFHASAQSSVDFSTEADFDWLLVRTVGRSNNIALARCLGEWKKLLDDGKWRIETSSFWNLPQPLGQVQQEAPELNASLAKSDLVIFKGDLNYRKLVNDREWEPQSSLQSTLGDFHVTSLAVVRPVSSPVLTNVKADKLELWTQKQQQDSKQPTGLALLDFLN